MTHLHRILQNRWSMRVARWALGVTFVYASYHKIIAPEAFAKIVYGYDLFPDATINLIAILLPFIELVTGLALIINIFPRGAAFIIMAMLVAFILLISVNLVRGHQFDCGCFSSAGAQAESPVITLIRDIFLLAIGTYIVTYQRRRPPA